MKWYLALRRYRHPIDGTHYEGEFHTKGLVRSLGTLDSFKQVKERMYELFGISIPNSNRLIWERRKLPTRINGASAEYAYVDATQPNPHGCVVTQTEVENGWEPNWTERSCT